MKRVRVQNLLLVFASYTFYGYWDWRFLSLLMISTVADYFIGANLHKTEKISKRKLLLAASIVVNLSILGFFKYFNFFVDSFGAVLESFGMQANLPSLRIILPVGISFYTFQTLSYTIDIYRKKLEPTKDFITFALFVSYFPQLVAGPIERAINLLPQLGKRRTITMEQVKAALFLITWGYFKKMVVADNLAQIADTVFNNYQDYSGLDITIGVLAFTFQIYCDFSGYSDIARGISKLMGIELRVNFKLPYFSLNPSDFWLRWHISLSSWLRDYLYIPLGGNRASQFQTLRNLSTTMLLGGLWHGASWNFVMWGAYHGLILIIYRLFDKNPEHMDPWGGEFPKWRIVIKMGIMFILTIFGWILFRAYTVDQIFYIFSNLGFGDIGPDTLSRLTDFLFFTVPFLVIHTIKYVSRNLLIITWQPAWVQGIFYGFAIAGILLYAVRGSESFIYFQF